MTESIDHNRRRLLQASTLMAAAIPLSALVHHRTATAAPQADDGHAHDYVGDAADAEDHARYQAGQQCQDCRFWEGEVEGGYGECSHPDFADVLVSADGWCDVFAPA
ncbi:high-potential iron-sulfur protein [Halorhodospira halophila]|uniref:High-potential iron-sulfur protein n=1 Tax=Halorhodospira halophila (strain DSM 244 / SL1) TaxID=349124 RepID=A1WZM9_HALHL|nr:high-potential iron-sulfur protein [Halorhodospira halophila]ABM63141.1 High potential iron-sulfur protein [Halorhodospira halophila SL1]MBK1729320.1 histidine kinase [Halorhodospira halophila]